MTNAEMERAVVGTVGADPQTPSSEPAAADGIVAQAPLPPSRSPRRSGHFFQVFRRNFQCSLSSTTLCIIKAGIKRFSLFFFFSSSPSSPFFFHREAALAAGRFKLISLKSRGREFSTDVWQTSKTV